MTDLDALAERLEADGVDVADVFECIGYAGHDIAKAMRARDFELGEGASSALLNALALLPLELRTDLVEALQDRSLMHPRLQRLAL